VPTGGNSFAAVASGGLELQLLPEFEVSALLAAGVPFGDTMSKASAVAGISVTYVFDRFDFYGSVSLGDLPSAALPYAAVGVAARFGG